MFTLSTFHTLYLFDKTTMAETCQRERKDGLGRRKKHRWEVKKAGCPGERAAPARPNGRNDDTKRPGRLSRRGSLRRSFGPFGIVAGVGGWSRKIKSLNDRRLVASLKFACVQPEGSWRKISQARGVKTKKRFYIWSTSGWGSGERGRKRDARRRKNFLPTRHAFAEKQYLCIS